MNRNRIAAAAVGVVVLVVIGIGIVLSGNDSASDPPVAGERPNPLGEEADDTQLPVDDPADDDGSSNPGDDDPNDEPTDAGATAAPTSSTTSTLAPIDAPVLVYAEARVSLGGGSRFAYLGDPEDREDYNELVREAAEDVDARDDLADPDPDVYQVVTNAACAVAQENILRVTRGGPTYQQLGAIQFGADFRIDQENFFSIADNGNGVATGGLSQGDGGRTTSQQWEIFAPSLDIYAMRLDRTIERYGNLAVPFVLVIAAWQGNSIENFSGDEVNGVAVVSCLWRVPE